MDAKEAQTGGNHGGQGEKVENLRGGSIDARRITTNPTSGESKQELHKENINNEDSTTSSTKTTSLPTDPSNETTSVSTQSKEARVTEASQKTDSPPSTTPQHITRSGTNTPASSAVVSSTTGQASRSDAVAVGGHDRVTVDRENQPLVQAGGTGAATNSWQSVSHAQIRPTGAKENATGSAAMGDSGSHRIATAVTNSHSNVVGMRNTPSTQIPVAVNTSSSKPTNTAATTTKSAVRIDVNSTSDEVLRKLRTPLIETYAPFIAPCDTSLSDARQRLRTALSQTHELRAAFTERVYGKYRVCLRPPPTIEATLNNILDDPEGAHTRLLQEIRAFKEEKEIEKKESQKLNAEMAESNVGGENGPSVNAENAEQLMFISAGLSLVILPEENVDTDEIDMSAYTDRGPTNSETGQRVRSISAAAAAAGDVMLDRTRKGAAMRVERQRRRQLQLLSGEDPERETDNNYSRLHVLSSTGHQRVDCGALQSQTPTVKAMSRSSASATKTLVAPPGNPGATKTTRPRIQSNISMNTLLSLNPSADELKPEGDPCAATSALIARGTQINTSNRSIQQRLRHPHPESLGARRALHPTQAKKEPNAAHLPADVQPANRQSLALPPLPTARQRRECRPLATHSALEASSAGARQAICSVLEQFRARNRDSVPSPDEVSEGSGGKDVTEICLLYGIQSTSEQADTDIPRARDAPCLSEPTSGSNMPTNPVPGGAVQHRVDPILAYSVLRAIGLVRSSNEKRCSSVNELLSVCDEIESEISVGETKADMSRRRQEKPSTGHLANHAQKISERKRTFSQAFPSLNPHAKRSESLEPLDSPLIASIRGGGEVLVDTTDDDPSVDPADGPRANTSNSAGGRSQDRQKMNGETSRIIGEPQQTAMAHPQAPIVREADLAQQRLFWEDHSHQSLALLNTRLSAADGGYAVASAGPANPLAAHFGSGNATTSRLQNVQGQHSHHPSASALLLAHQLQQGQRNAGDLAEYLGGLHAGQRPSAYDWSSLGAASAAAVAAAHSSLTALGINRHHPQMVGFSVDDRARALLAQDHHSAAAHAAAAQRQTLSTQQAGAFLGNAANHGFHQTVAQPTGFPQVTAPQPPTASLLNSSAASALMSHAQLMASPPNPPSPKSKPSKTSGQHSLLANAINSAGISSRGAKKSAKDSQEDSEGLEQRSDSNSSLGPTSVKRKPSEVLEQRAATETTAQNRSSAVRLVALKRRRGNSMSEAHGHSPAEPSSEHDKPSARSDTKQRDKSERMGEAVAESVDADGKDAERNDIAFPTADPEKQNVEPESRPPRAHDDSSLEGKSSKTPCPPQPTPSADVAETQPCKPEAEPSTISDDSRRACANHLDVSSGQRPNAVASNPLTETPGLQFFLSPPPQLLPSHIAGLIQVGRIHEALPVLSNPESSAKVPSALEYLVAVGTAVPIPKALVANPLKEKLNTPGFKNPANGGAPAIPREIVIASILVWLWNKHEDSFQRAFTKGGRIDVDPDCKWLIQAAVDAAVRALTLEIADALARGGSPLAVALAANKAKNSSSMSSAGAKGTDAERPSPSSPGLGLLTATIVSRALMAALRLDGDMDGVIPRLNDLVQFLDDARVCALQTKSKERAFLATLISRRANMSESFSHAYTSAMVRAGEALGHGDLFEGIQSEDVMVSTMMPYDVFTDETGVWENPCRPSNGFTENLTGEDLVRRAHARAMIHKSLRKLQDRHNVKGGVANSGPYQDSTQALSAASSGANDANCRSSQGPASSGSSQRSWTKRKLSSITDPPILPGTGSAAATSRVLFEPNHSSAPLQWSSDDIENSPYGRHAVELKVRSMSLGGLAETTEIKSSKKPKMAKKISAVLPSQSGDHVDRLLQSTHEIDWADVAGIFQPVALPGSTAANKSKEQQKQCGSKSTIFAPFCRKIHSSSISGASDESDEDEDLSEESVLAQHQIVLDGMKEKLSAFLEARKKHHERSKNRDKQKT